MKSVELAKVVALGLMLSVAVVGCKRSPRGITHIPGQAGQRMPGIDPNAELGGGGLNEGDLSRFPIDEGGVPQSTRLDDSDFNLDREAFREQTVYFDYDSSTVRPSERSKVGAVAAYLKGDSTNHVKVEGHCDERGTAEYNRALGERRALSIREQLIAEGIAPDRVHTISFGEDQPAALGSDESAWSRNRRGEFVLMRPKS